MRFILVLASYIIYMPLSVHAMENHPAQLESVTLVKIPGAGSHVVPLDARPINSQPPRGQCTHHGDSLYYSLKNQQAESFHQGSDLNEFNRVRHTHTCPEEETYYQMKCIVARLLVQNRIDAFTVLESYSQDDLAHLHTQFEASQVPLVEPAAETALKEVSHKEKFIHKLKRLTSVK